MNAWRGFSMIEGLVALALLGLVVALAVPNLAEIQRRSDLAGLTQRVVDDTRRARMEALMSGRGVGLIFAQERGRWFYTMVADGDGDGVSRSDLRYGIDKPLGAPIWLEFLSPGAGMGVPTGWRVPDPGGSGWLPQDGLRLGRSDILAFSRFGQATPSTMYFNDGQRRMFAVRVNGDTGRIRVIAWERGWRQWRDTRM
jgi:prepilin-type N-terminal cleavage/methylation domain-containing protein